MKLLGGGAFMLFDRWCVGVENLVEGNTTLIERH